MGLALLLALGAGAGTRDNPAFDGAEVGTSEVGETDEPSGDGDGEPGGDGDGEPGGDGDGEPSGDGDGEPSGDGDGEPGGDGDGGPAGDGDGEPEPLWACPEDEGLVACYRFDGPEPLADESGYGNHASAQVLGLIEGVDGLALDCLTSTKVLVDDSPSLDTAAELTLALWILREVEAGPMRQVWLENPQQYGVWFIAEQGLVLSANVGPMTYAVSLGPEAVPVGVWTHVALVFDGGDLVGFVDGEVAFESSAAGPIATANTEQMGLGNGSPEYNLTSCPGRVDQITIFDRALGIEEILELL